MTTTATPSFGVMPQQRVFRRRLRLIPPLEIYPTVLSFVQTGVGNLVLLAVFGAGLRYTSRYWLPILFLLTVMTSFAKHRRLLLTFGTLLWTFSSAARRGTIGVVEAAAILAIAGLLFGAAARWIFLHFARFDYVDRTYPLSEHLRFFAHLFNLAS
jgi:hypothetical protein